MPQAIPFLGGLFGASAAIATTAAGAAAWAIGAQIGGSVLFKLASSVAFSALSTALTPKAKQSALSRPGIQTPFATSGGLDAQKVIVGRFATAGLSVCPDYAHGRGHDHKVRIIELSNAPGTQLLRVMIDGVYSALGSPHPEYGFPILAKQRGDGDAAWVKYYDGTQTAADPGLVNRFGPPLARPWTAAHVGRGICYAILTFRLHQDVKAVPDVRFELGGVPLYDPRYDSTVGGIAGGVQRWGQPWTYQPTTNPIVIAYNVARGITLPSGDVYGGRYTAEELPLSSWFVAMGECDKVVNGRRQFECGYEIDVGEEPASVMEQLGNACLAKYSEFGGSLRVRVGGPSVPVALIHADDVLISRPEDRKQIKGIEKTFNAIQVSYTSPEDLYEGREVPLLTNAQWEAEDGGRRVIPVSLPAVTNRGQAMQIQAAMIKDDRRTVTHSMFLPPQFLGLNAMDTFALTDPELGYDNKIFEVVTIEIDTLSQLPMVVATERDPEDFNPGTVTELPAPPEPLPVVVAPPQEVEGFVALATSVVDGDGAPRRPAIRLEYTPEANPDLRGIQWQIQTLNGTFLIDAGSVDDVSSGVIIRAPQSILSLTSYRARLRYIARRATVWTDWQEVTTGDFRLGSVDLADGLSQKIDEAFDRHDAALADATGVVAELRDAAFEQIDIIGHNLVGIQSRLDPIAPAQRSIADRLEQVAQQLTFGLARIQRTDQRMSDAGIVTDPETGRARIFAVEALDGRISDVSIELNAAQAAITARATLAEVNEAIAAAQLGETELADLTTLKARVTDVELLLDALEGLIALKADTVLIDGIDTRLVDAELEIDSLAGTIALKVDQSEFDAAETRLTTAEQELSTLDGASIRQSVIDRRQQFDEIDLTAITSFNGLWKAFQDRRSLRDGVAFATQEINARVTEGFAAEAVARLQLAAQIEGTQAALQTEQTARATADEALAQAVTQLQAGLNQAESGLTAQAGAVQALTGRVDATEAGLTAQAQHLTSLATGLGTAQGDIGATSDALDTLTVTVSQTAQGVSALATRTGTLEAQVQTPGSGLLARVSNVEATRVTAQGAVAAVNQQLTATYGDLTALAEATAFAEATLDGISSGFVWSLGGDNVLSLVRVDDGLTGPSVTARLRSSYISLDGDVDVSGDFLAKSVFAESAWIKRAAIEELAVDTLRIADRAVTFPVIAFANFNGLNVTGGTNLLSLVITRSGLPTFIQFSASCDSTQGTSWIRFRLFRDGVLIAEFEESFGNRTSASLVFVDNNL